MNRLTRSSLLPVVLSAALLSARAAPPSLPPAGAAVTFDETHRPPVALLRAYLDAGQRRDIPEPQKAALEKFVATASTERMTPWESAAAFVKHPPDDDTMRLLLQPSSAIPKNLVDGVGLYLYRKPLSQMSELEIKYEIHAIEGEANPPAAHRQALARLENALAVKEGRPVASVNASPSPTSPAGTSVAGGPAGAPADAAVSDPSAGAASPSPPAGSPPAEPGSATDGAAADGGDAGATVASVGGQAPPLEAAAAAAQGGAAGSGEAAPAALAEGSQVAANTAGVGALGGEVKTAFDASARAAAGEMGAASGSARPAGKTAPSGVAARREASGEFAAPARSEASPGAQAAAGGAADGTAPLREPDFFVPARGGISREDYASLKESYRGGGAKGEDFKDMALTPPGEERDFSWSRSCELVAGDCNGHAEKSYEKGDRVPAADLKHVVASLRQRLLAAAERRRLERGSGAGLSAAGGRLGGLLGRLRSWVRGGDGEAGGGPASGGLDAVGRAQTTAGGLSPGESGALGVGGVSPSAAGRSVRPESGEASGHPWGWTFLGGLAAGLLLAAAIAVLKRERGAWRG